MNVGISENWELVIDTALTEVGALRLDQSEYLFSFFLVQVNPAFLQRIHFLIFRIGVPALVNVVQFMDRKVIITVGNTSIIPFTIKHSLCNHHVWVSCHGPHMSLKHYVC